MQACFLLLLFIFSFKCLWFVISYSSGRLKKDRFIHMQNRVILSADSILGCILRESFIAFCFQKWDICLCWIFELNILCMSNSECLFESVMERVVTNINSSLYHFYPDVLRHSCVSALMPWGIRFVLIECQLHYSIWLSA